MEVTGLLGHAPIEFEGIVIIMQVCQNRRNRFTTIVFHLKWGFRLKLGIYEYSGFPEKLSYFYRKYFENLKKLNFVEVTRFSSSVGEIVLSFNCYMGIICDFNISMILPANCFFFFGCERPITN